MMRMLLTWEKNSNQIVSLIETNTPESKQEAINIASKCGYLKYFEDARGIINKLTEITENLAPQNSAQSASSYNSSIYYLQLAELLFILLLSYLRGFQNR